MTLNDLYIRARNYRFGIARVYRSAHASDPEDHPVVGWTTFLALAIGAALAVSRCVHYFGGPR